MMTNPADDRTIVTELEALALAAGKRIMEICREGFEADSKADDSPVTRADREAETIILAGLRARFRDTVIVAEEEVSAGVEPQIDAAPFFLVDPLDGTREFVAGKDDFTVNIALVRNGVPVIGVVYAPAQNALYSGAAGRAESISTDAHHRPIERKTITARLPGQPLLIVASRSHRTQETNSYIAGFEASECVSVGSSLKFCLLASGQADLYPRMGRTMQWDTAAGDAVLRAAGGMTTTLDGQPFVYGPGTAPDDERFANPHFIARGLGALR
jgi:3'(2'), 5'-bisphosphate nucleotidase